LSVYLVDRFVKDEKMRVVVIQASTRTEINQLLFNTVCEAVGGPHEVVNLGVFPEDGLQ